MDSLLYLIFRSDSIQIRHEPVLLEVVALLNIGMKSHPFAASRQEFNNSIIFQIPSSVYILTTMQWFMLASAIFLMVSIFCSRPDSIQRR